MSHALSASSTRPTSTKRWMSRRLSATGLALLLATSLMSQASSVHAQGSATQVGSADRASVFALLFPRPATATGQSATLMPDGRWLLAGGLAANGRSGTALKYVDPSNNRSTPVAKALLRPRSGHTATLLPDGSVLILGGTDERGAIAPAERFDPASGVSSEVIGLTVLPRSHHAATLLADGRLLITGGVSARGEPLAEAELVNTFDLKVDRFNARTESARFGHLSHLLPSNAVLLVSGFGPDKRPMANAELYDVQTQRFASVSSDRALEHARALSAPGTPGIVGVRPADDARDVPVDQIIALRLSKRMLVSSMNEKTVTLIGPSGSVPINVVPAEAGLLLFVTPKHQLLPASTYTLFLKGATDEYGVSVPMTSSAFTTVALGAGQAVETRGRLPVGGRPGSGTVGGKWQALESRTLLPAGPVNATAAAGVPVAGSNQEEDENWHVRAAQRRGKWYYAKPFSGTMRQYFQHVDDRRKGFQSQTLSAPAGVTAVAGLVRKVNGRPLANVTLAIGDARGTTDAQGRFLLTNVPAGAATLVIEGSTANRGDAFYGSYLRKVDVQAGQTTKLNEPIFLAKLDPAGTVQIPSPTTRETVITTPTIPGLEIRIPPGTVIRDRLGNILTAINISPVPTDRAAFPMPEQAEFPVYFTVQPSGAFIQSVAGGPPQPVKVIYPNYTDQPPGSPVQFWAYDPVDRGWHSYGKGVISVDGKTIQPDASVGFYQFTGFSFGIFGTGGGGGPCGACCRGNGGAGGGSGGGGGGGGGAGAGGGAGDGSCGDPVLLARGTFLHSMTDLSVNDVVPVALERAFMDKDTANRAFGIGMMHRFDMNLFPMGGNSHAPTQIAMIQPNGMQLIFNRVLGSSVNQTTWEHTASPGPFYKATIRDKSPVFEVRLRDGTVYSFIGYSFNKLQSIQDRFGNLIELERTPALYGPITKVISPNGRFIEMTYDPADRITSAKDNIGRTVLYEYHTTNPGNGRLKKVTMPDGGTWQYTYTTAGRVETIIDPRGNRMVLNEYDANERLMKQTYADNTTVQIAYTADGSGNITQTDVTDKRGNVRRVKFDANQQITESTYPLGKPEAQTTTFSRDATSGRLNSSTDALGRITAYQYDALGNVVSTTRLFGTPNAVNASSTYDQVFSVVKTRTDELLRTTTYNYDALGNPTLVTDPNGNTVEMTYDSSGRVLTSKNGLGHTTSYAYNGPDLVSVADSLGNVTRFGYDGIGRTQMISDPLNNLSEMDYDANGRLSQRKGALGSTVNYQYDLLGNRLQHQDQNGNATIYTYDAMNRRATRKDGLLAVETQAYEPGGQVASSTDRKGQVSGTRYDGLGRMTFRGFGGTVAAPTTYTDGIRYTWDAGNRLTKIEDGTCAGIDCTNFTVTSTIDRAYDGLDRLTQETSPQGQVSYTYFPNGLRHSMTVSGQPTVSYTYDSGNRLVGISQAAAASNANTAQSIGFVYDAANRRTRTTLPNGITIDYGFDSASRLTALTYRKADASLIGDITYAYDAAGRRTVQGGSMGETGLPGDITVATHNANNQLTEWGVGASPTSLVYDANGNLTNDGIHAYLWDSRNQLVEIRQGTATGALVASFQYDGFGRRAAKTVAGATTGYLHDGWNVVQELNAHVSTGAAGGYSNYRANLINGLELDERYVRIVAPNSGLPNQPNNPANPSASTPLVSYFVTDALGSTIRLMRADQSVQAHYEYQVYGETFQTTPIGQPPSDNPYQYTGRENDAVLLEGNGVGSSVPSLYHYRHRYYSPQHARFTREDPIEFDGGPNFYVYADGNPLMFVDPEGLAPSPGDNSLYPPTHNCTCVQNCMEGPTPPFTALGAACGRAAGYFAEPGRKRFAIGGLAAQACIRVEKAVGCSLACSDFCSGKVCDSPYPSK